MGDQNGGGLGPRLITRYMLPCTQATWEERNMGPGYEARVDVGPGYEARVDVHVCRMPHEKQSDYCLVQSTNRGRDLVMDCHT